MALPSTPTNLHVVKGGQVSTTGPALLQPSDFTYLGYYDLQTAATDGTPYMQGLSHRYVNGDLRLLSLIYGVLHETSIGSKPFGAQITSKTRAWGSVGGTTNGGFNAVWWEEARQRLWTLNTIDYSSTAKQIQVFTRTLNDDGTVSNLRGPIGLQGLASKRAYGGAQAVPVWFQQQYGVGPYVIGWGGYTSLMAQSGIASLGLTTYSMPDPDGFASNTEVPVGQYKVLADHFKASTVGDWYGAGAPSGYDRGARVTIPINYFDGGDPRQNPTTAPTDPPAAGAQWLSPSPDGRGRWVWGDSYYNTGCWIDGPNKHGFIAVAALGTGKCWYGSSTLHFDGRTAELHIYDPAHLGEVAQGTRPIWNVQPVSMTELQLSGTYVLAGGNTTLGNAAGATYDPIGKRLYVSRCGTNGTWQRIYVYQVAA